MSKLQVIDFFCGAGGFSEGFRQMGFEIVCGYDNWKPAIDTYNHNFNLNCKLKNILDFKNSIVEIENLPNTEIIVGSPPCVSFSSSNKSGNADKSLGVKLTETFLRIVAVKKHQPKSKLKAWYMENVVNSVKYLNDYYTFEDLDLSTWAIENKIRPNDIAIVLNGNQHIINSADYGSPQSRKRMISGEFVEIGKLIIPTKTHQPVTGNKELPNYITLGQIKKLLPNPNSGKLIGKIPDPLYPNIMIEAVNLSDHFYDTGLYECEWRQSKFLKTNHPFMGKMSFPENEDKPSRTVIATKIGSSREAIIYKSEFVRRGDGEYRLPTIRELASLMGFPITYQFIGSEGAKSRLVGNAVCPSVSRTFAKIIRKEFGLIEIDLPVVTLEPNLRGVENLNSFLIKSFNNTPRRIKGSRFRRHPLKDGNMTVTLSNYDITKNEKTISEWMTSVQYGNGKGFPTFNIPNNYYRKIEPLIEKVNSGKSFLSIINNGFTEKIGNKMTLQEMYETHRSREGLLEPTMLVEEVKRLIEGFEIDNEDYIQEDQVVFKNKVAVPIKQLFAMYAINKISTIANSSKYGSNIIK